MRSTHIYFSDVCKMGCKQIGDQTMVTQGTVVGGCFYAAAKGLELGGDLRQFFAGSRTEKNRAGLVAAVPSISEKEQGGNADATADKANRICRHGSKSSPQRPDETECLSRTQLREQSCTPTDYLEQQLNLLRSDAPVNGKRAAE